MSKLSFRARALDAAKPMAVYMARELPDLPEMTVINRAVPQMPTGMEKEEETEHHLQRAIVAGLIIPTPEVFEVDNMDYLNHCYPADTKLPRQFIHMQPIAMEQDVPEYDLDSEDESWLNSQGQKLELSPLQFEEMMDRLEKSSGQTVITLNEAKALLKQDDDLIIAVYDYWLHKRLRLQHPLIPQLKTDKYGGPTASTNPYVAFRRRTEKMQTRKHRKNDEASYEKMLKLKRDLSRALTLLEMVKKREKLKREFLSFGINVFEKRYHLSDFNGQILSEVSASVRQQPRPPFSPLALSQAVNVWPGSPGTVPGQGAGTDRQTVSSKEELRKDRRPYRKRRHKLSVSGGVGALPGRGVTSNGTASVLSASRALSGFSDAPSVSSDEEMIGGPAVSPSDVEEESDTEKQPFVFRRLANCSYYAPTNIADPWPWSAPDQGGMGDPRFRYTLASLRHPAQHCVGFARRRVGRGGRVILDRARTDLDDAFGSLDPEPHSLWFKRRRRYLDADFQEEIRQSWRHYRPRDSLGDEEDHEEEEPVHTQEVVPASVSIGIEGDEASYLDFDVLHDGQGHLEDVYNDSVGSSSFRVPSAVSSGGKMGQWMPEFDEQDELPLQQEVVISNGIQSPNQIIETPVWVAPKSGALPSNHSIVSPCPAEDHTKISVDDASNAAKEQTTVVDFLLLDGTFAMEVS